MPDALLEYLSELNRKTFLLVEYGVESINNQTLQRINRGHSFETARETIEKTAKAGIMTGAHIILGLPGEEHDELIKQTENFCESEKADNRNLHPAHYRLNSVNCIRY